MSDTVLTFRDNGSDDELIDKLAALTGPELPVGPYTLAWHAFTGTVQRWTYGLISCTLSFDKDSKIFTLMLSNLVA